MAHFVADENIMMVLKGHYAPGMEEGLAHVICSIADAVGVIGDHLR